MSLCFTQVNGVMEDSVPSTSSTAPTRGIWLIGGVSESITGSKLPSNRQVLSRFFFLHTMEKKTIQESAAITAQETVSYWDKARIPTRQHYHIINKIKEQHMKWQNLKKAATRRTEIQQQKEDSFSNVLDDLFDVAHADALNLVKIPEDKEFLLAQWEKGRRGCFGSVGMKLHGVEKRRYERDQKVAKRRKLEEERMASAAVCEVVGSSHISSSSSCSNSESEQDPVYKKCTSKKSAVKKSSQYCQLRGRIIPGPHKSQ